MTKEELNQLNDLKEEIKELEQELERLHQRKIESTFDKVKASYSGFPYIQGNATIYGYNVQAEHAKNQAIENKIKILAARQAKAKKEEEKIQNFINTVNESKIRRILEYRYVKGYTWGKIGELMHCDRTTAEKIISKYLAQAAEQKEK